MANRLPAPPIWPTFWQCHVCEKLFRLNWFFRK
jgi:hypothetical protein